MWRRGEEVFAEWPSPMVSKSAGMGIHPVLLDAALHAVGLTAEATQMLTGGAGLMALPFSWEGCRCMPPGRAARVRIAPAGDGAVSVELADTRG